MYSESTWPSETITQPQKEVKLSFDENCPRIHMMICCPGATSLVNFIVLGQVHRHQITTNLFEFLLFLHKLLKRMNFKYVYLFLVLSGTYYWEIYSKH